MKCINTTLFVIILLNFFLNSQADAQNFWQPTNGISGGHISSITKISSSILIAGSYRGGLFRSVDNGENWISISNEVDNYYVFTVKSKPSGLVFAGTNRSLYRSTNWGMDWQLIKNDLPTFNYVEDITFDNSGNVYITYSVAGIFKSTNDGDNWIPINNGINPNPYITRIEHTSNNILIATDNYDGIYKSTDLGASWSLSNSGFAVNSNPTSITANSSGHIFLGSYGTGVYKSTNDGTSWSLINGDIDNYYMFDIATNSASDIFIATYSGLYKSTNNGTNWSSISTGLSTSEINCITIENDNNLWIGTSFSGIAKSTDAGSNWTFYSNGLSSTQIISLVSDNSGNLYALAVNKGVYKSSDNGDTWSQLTVVNDSYDLSITALETIPSGGLIVNSSSGGISVTKDYANWFSFNSGLSNLPIRALSASDNYYFAGSSDGKIYRTPVSSAAWADITDTLSTNLIYDLGVKPTGEVFAITDNGVYKSTNNGDAWLNINNGIPVTYYFSIAFHPNGDVFVGGSGVYRSTDNGDSWTVSTTGMSNIGGLSIAIHPNGSIFAGTFNSVFRSNDTGSTWELLGDGLENIRVLTLAFGKSDILVAGTEGLGVYKAGLPVTSISDDKTISVYNFSLNQNYPNPFNPATKIQYQISQNAHVVLKIFDVLGNLISTPVDQFQSVGNYEVEFSSLSDGLPTGVYFYRLQAAEYTETKKMILIR